MSKQMIERLLIHSKLHKGGMKSKHMILMMKFIKDGLTFTKAHNRTKKIQAENMKPKKMIPKKMKMGY